MISKNDPNKIIKEWDSQKTAANDLSINVSTLKYRLDNKCIFKQNDQEFYLIRQIDYS